MSSPLPEDPPAAAPPVLDHRSLRTPSPRPPFSPLAVTALVSSLLFLIPFVTSITGFILSLVAIRSIKKHHLSGRRFAIPALLLGLAGILFWTTASILGVYIHHQIHSAPTAVAEPFIRALVAADYPTATTLATPTFPPADLKSLNTYTKTNYGTFQSLAYNQMIMNFTPYNKDLFNIQILHNLTFSNKPATVRLTLVLTPNGFKVDYCSFTP